ncbi:MAG TPA: tetratricopeptide repeat protein [Candidatus Udaeobacter sp.]|jgi:tetratricopeptide (TPR) repeat protein|nr:tetratricopeptide repeat protein [Candidatus Udaeobacter sp.]
MMGDPKVALAHFQRAAQLDPNYILNFTPLSQGVWTYVGRAYYKQKEFSEARKAFETARSRHQEDNLARLYLGLVLARDGSRQQGLREIEAGLTGLGEWLDSLERYHAEGQFWDPRGDLKNEIQKNLAVIYGKDIDWDRLILGVEWLGEKFEEEIDLARRDERQELMQDGDDGGEEP